MTPITDPWFYAAAIPAVIIVGLSKGGFGGTLAMFGVPSMALVVSPVQAAGIMLPILVLMDAIALFAYKGEADKKTLLYLLPAAVIGIGIGWATAAYVNEIFVTLLIGVMSLIFVLDYLIKRKRNLAPADHNLKKGVFWGTITGFTSFVSHTGGPPYQLYTVPLRLTPTLFAGTAVIFFAVVNAIKLVPYFLLGQFDSQNLMTSLVLLPLAPLATLAGVRLVRIINQELFYKLIYAIMAVIGLKLIVDGLIGLIG